MMTRQLTHQVSRFGHMGALLVVAMSLPACIGAESDFEDVAEVSQAEGWTGTNNVGPYGIATRPLKRSVTDHFGVTTPSNPNPSPLCSQDSVTSTGCTLNVVWERWMKADLQNRATVMKGIAKCSVAHDFSIQDSSGTMVFPGQWELYPEWKSNRLDGQDKRERVSSCILSLLNGNDATLLLCIIGPGGSPFSDACSDPNITTREGGFFGDLFAATPTAYVAGPDSADPALTGRACFAEEGNYCCAEEDISCDKGIVLAGAILGSPDQNFANRRCNAELVDSGGNWYCPSFFSTREPGRSYTNVFTTFVPPLE